MISRKLYGNKRTVNSLLIMLMLGTVASFHGAAAESNTRTPGSLDISFGTATDDGTPAGIVSTSLGKGDDIANDIATTSDGKILVVGNRNNGQSNDIVVVRYNADGSFDTAFGKADDGTPDGVVNLSLGDGDDFATSLALQADGKIVVGGYHQQGSSTNMVVLRLNSDGTLDQGFGTANDGTENGIVNISLGDGDDIGRSVAMTSGGKIVLVGDSVTTDGSSNIVVARLNADGSPDTSFGTDGTDGTPDGFVSVSLGNGNDIANSVAIAQDGKIVVSGSHGQTGNANMAVLRLNADGTLDQNFGTANDGTPNGVVSLSFGDGNDIARGVAVTTSGQIVIVGDSKAPDGSNNIIVARLNADGSLDESFGVGNDGTPNGVTSTSLGSGNDFGTDLVVETDGDIVVAGYHEAGSSTNIAVLRFKANGELDQTFATSDDGTPNGIASLSLGDGNDIASGVALQGDKLIVVGGTTVASDGSKNIAVVRLFAD